MKFESYVDKTAKITDSTISDPVKIYRDGMIRGSSVGSTTTIGDQTILINTELESNIVINRRNFIQDSVIGRYTYSCVRQS
jgi:bifunctional N-acetylglucosamine-1-phosphate-uridyltransferase/glucosamine-1-phosphate-acetyltransferase GlmU-like protein